MKNILPNKQFGLLEVLVFFAALAALIATAVVILNPNQQRVDVRNNQRNKDINSIADAVHSYVVNEGNLPESITPSSLEICRSGVSDCSGLIDLSVLTKDGKYLVSLPIDPLSNSDRGTGYHIKKTDDKHVVVTAPFTEQSSIISVSR